MDVSGRVSRTTEAKEYENMVKKYQRREPLL
jgi:hypothetical protein